MAGDTEAVGSRGGEQHFEATGDLLVDLVVNDQPTARNLLERARNCGGARDGPGQRHGGGPGGSRPGGRTLGGGARSGRAGATRTAARRSGGRGGRRGRPGNRD